MADIPQQRLEVGEITSRLSILPMELQESGSRTRTALSTILTLGQVIPDRPLHRMITLLIRLKDFVSHSQ